jgi:hypothetical protein
LGGLIDHDFLMVFVDGRNPDHAGHEHVGASARVANFPDPLPWSETLDLNLSRQNCGFVIVK